jgi:hypothetical protein
LGIDAFNSVRGRAATVAVCLVVGLAAPASAQITTNWVGGVDTDWTNPANWNPGVFRARLIPPT